MTASQHRSASSSTRRFARCARCSRAERSYLGALARDLPALVATSAQEAWIPMFIGMTDGVRFAPTQVPIFFGMTNGFFVIPANAGIHPGDVLALIHRIFARDSVLSSSGSACSALLCEKSFLRLLTLQNA